MRCMTGILSRAAYYASCKRQTRRMRDVIGAFEDKLAKGERRALRKLELDYFVSRVNVSDCYHIVEDNRLRKGRKYGISRKDWDEFERVGLAHCFAVYPGPISAALCVPVSREIM